MTARLRRGTALLAAVLALGAQASAYYHYVRFGGSTAAPERLVERFDVERLVDSRAPFFVSTRMLPEFSVNDSYAGLLSQVRQALGVWDAVPTSSLRVGFGGLVDGEVPGEAPAGLIVFEELPPGVLGLGGPVLHEAPRDGFLPIVRSQVVLSTNLSNGIRPRTSFSELFFATLVHEIGHALGLQHTLASSAMSTDATRATSRARPLAEDDIAGLAALYPTEEALSATGSVAGRVTFRSGQPAALASVAAVHSSGAVITALTDPDGRYRIEGLPPGEHLLYVQPMPPATQDDLGPANVVLPRRLSDDARLEASGPFFATFYGAAARPAASPRVRVAAGRTTGDIDFTVRPRGDTPLPNVTTYSFPGNGAPGVHPAYLNLTRDGGFVLAAGGDLAAQVGSLEVEALHDAVAVDALSLYSRAPQFVQIDFGPAPFSSFGPVHLLFRTPDDFYVLPSAVQLTPQAAPILHWLTPDFSQPGDVWRLRGEGLLPVSQVFFDGEAAQIVGYDSEADEILVAPPPAPPGHRAVVTVYNPDGQSSAFTLPDGNVVFEYPAGAAPSVNVVAPTLEPDRDVVVRLQVRGFELQPGSVELGAGSSDLTVRQVEVAGPNEIVAVVSASADASAGSYPATLIDGLHVVRLPDALTVSTTAFSDGRRPRLRYGGLVNSATGEPDVAPGSLASLFGERLIAPIENVAGVRVTIGGVEARILGALPGQINLEVPSALSPGAYELVVFNGEATSDPMLVNVSRVAPGVFGAMHADGSWINGSATLEAGETIDLVATGLGAELAAQSASSPTYLQVVINGVRLRPTGVIPMEGFPGLFRIRFELPPSTAATASGHRVSLLVLGRSSNELSFR